MVALPTIILLRLCGSSQVCNAAKLSARILASSHSSVKLGSSAYYLQMILCNSIHYFYYLGTFYDIFVLTQSEMKLSK